MKRLYVLVCLLAVGVVAGLSQLTPLRADAWSATAVSAPTATTSANAKEEAKTFQGKITQAQTTDGKTVYVLLNSADKDLWILDDQEKAKQFDGKDVKVTGTLDMATRTIHVLDIQQSA